MSRTASAIASGVTGSVRKRYVDPRGHDVAKLELAQLIHARVDGRRLRVRRGRRALSCPVQSRAEPREARWREASRHSLMRRAADAHGGRSQRLILVALAAQAVRAPRCASAGGRAA